MSAFLTEMWSWYALTWFITITRMISRMLLLRSIRKFQVEDFLALAAMLTDTVIMIGMSILSRTNTNLFDPKQNIILTPEEISNRMLGSKMIVLVESMQCTTIWLMKGCLLIMYYRLTTSLKQNLAVKIVGGYVVFGFVLMMVLYLGVWCRPISGYWAVPQANPECNASPSHLKLNAVLNISSDLMIISIPMPLLIRSKLPPKRKAVLCGVFALGTFTILCAILSKVYSFREPYSDRWTFWYVRESSTAIITANLPYVWTLLRRIFNLKAFNESSQRSTSKPTTLNLRSGLSRTHRSGDPQSLRISRSDSQEQINMSYSVPLKIYQRHEVEITSEEVFGNDTDRPTREFEYNGGLKTTAVAGKDKEFEARSRNEETASERSGNESINAFQGV